MTKKRKFATALLATALLSNGFILETKEEVTIVEPESTTEVIQEKAVTPIIEPQYLVAQEEVKEFSIERQGIKCYKSVKDHLYLRNGLLFFRKFI